MGWISPQLENHVWVSSVGTPRVADAVSPSGDRHTPKVAKGHRRVTYQTNRQLALPLTNWATFQELPSLLLGSSLE